MVLSAHFICLLSIKCWGTEVHLCSIPSSLTFILNMLWSYSVRKHCRNLMFAWFLLGLLSILSHLKFSWSSNTRPSSTPCLEPSMKTAVQPSPYRQFSSKLVHIFEKNLTIISCYAESISSFLFRSLTYFEVNRRWSLQRISNHFSTHLWLAFDILDPILIPLLKL